MTGAQLADGRRVVVKAHQPRAIGAPETAWFGFATAQTLIDRGQVRGTHDPDGRRLIAEASQAEYQWAVDELRLSRDVRDGGLRRLHSPCHRLRCAVVERVIKVCAAMRNGHASARTLRIGVYWSRSACAGGRGPWSSRFF